MKKQEEFSLKNYFVPFTTAKAASFLIIIGIAVFFFGLFNGFVGDDQIQIVRNPAIQSLFNIPSFFSGSTFYTGGQQLAGFSYKPILDIFYAFCFFLGGGSAFPFHFIQLLLYIADAVILFFVLKKFFNTKLSFFLSLLFLVHPINSESAYYIADMQEVLFFFFGSISLLIFQNHNSPKAIISASVLLLFSLLSKETGILFLMISLTYIFIYKRKIFLPSLGASIVLLLIYAVLRISAIGIFPNTPLTSNISALTLGERLIDMPAILFFYIKTFIFPQNLAISYQWIYREISFSTFFLPLISDLVFLGILSYLGFYVNKKSKDRLKLFLFFGFWFAIGTLLLIQIIPLDQTVSDRWFYFPVVGLLGMLGVFIKTVKMKLDRRLIIAISIILVSLLSLRTFMRSFDFKNDFTIASHDIKVSPASFGLENELASAYAKQGNYRLSKLQAEKSLALRPTQTSYIDLGVADTFLGDYGGAQKAYLSSLKFGDYYITYENLAALYIVYGNPKQNISYIKNVALKKFPNDYKLWLYVAILEYKNGFKAQATTDIKNAYALNPSQQILPVYNTILNGKKLNTFFNLSK